MYVTRRLPMYQKDPSALSLPPPDGPDTGILVIQDVEKELKHPCCFGMCMSNSFYYITDLPFPQNTQLRTQTYFTSDSYDFRNFMAIPVINKPLSTGLYYILDSEFISGCAYTSNGTKGKYKSCFCLKSVKEAGRRPLDPSNTYQQFYIRRGSRGFQFESFASDGHVPRFFKNTYGTVFSRLYYYDFQLDDASGLDHSLRERLPEFDFPLSQETSDAVVVGKCSNSKDVIAGDSVVVNENVETEVVDVNGMKNCENTKVSDGVKWFIGLDKEGGAAAAIGLDRVIIDKIMRDQESFGWVGGKAKVKRVEKFERKDSEWKKFGCYVLVEKYVLRRGDKILEQRELRRGDKKLVLTYEFWHTQHIRCKWE